MSSTIASARRRARCPSCGEENRCGFGGESPCWCAAPEVGRLEPAAGADTCYCRKCLERLLAERTRAVT